MKPPVGPVVHLRVDGDLETAQDLRSIRAALDEAAAAKSALIVMELDGNESRQDLVVALGQVLHEAKAPVAVFLNDPKDHTVGPGQLCLAAVAQRSGIAPGMLVRGQPNPMKLAALAPEGTSWSDVQTDLLERVQRARKLPEGLAAALISPTRPLWLEFAPEARVVTAAPTQANGAAPLVSEVLGGFEVAMEARTATRLGLCENAAAWTALIGSDAASGARTDRVLSIGLVPVLARTSPLIEGIDASLDRAKAGLKLPWPVSTKVARSAYREAASKAAPELDAAEAGVRALEQLLIEYPELLRRPAPGQTEVAAKPSTCTARWRSLVQTRKDHAAKLRSTLEKFESVAD